MAQLTKAERQVINQLLDHTVFTGSKTPDMHASDLAARDAYQRPEGQRRINGWFNQVFGQTPKMFQDSWLWLMGPGRLAPDAVVVMLATFKAVINTPTVQGVEADRVIESRPVIASVQTAVPTWSDKQVAKMIDTLFVERLQLLTPDNPEVADPALRSQVVDEFWDVDIDFVPVAQLMVTALQQQTNAQPTAAQQVNAYLLTHRYLDREHNALLWAVLQQQKTAIEALWAPLARFYLEVGDDYAVLLDGNRRQRNSQPYFVALGVAATLKSGLPDEKLSARIKAVAQKMYPGATINAAQVKAELHDNALAQLSGGTWLATTVASRFKVLEDEDDQ